MLRRSWIASALACLTGAAPARGADPKPLTFTVYADAEGEVRWRLRAPNGRILADSGESYRDLRDARHAIDLVRAGAASARVVGPRDVP